MWEKGGSATTDSVLGNMSMLIPGTNWLGRAFGLPWGCCAASLVARRQLYLYGLAPSEVLVLSKVVIRFTRGWVE